MANNRLYLTCRCGGEPFYLARYNVVDWHVAAESPAQLGVDLAAWLDRHSYCDGVSVKDAMYGDWIGLEYECESSPEDIARLRR